MHAEAGDTALLLRRACPSAARQARWPNTGRPLAALLLRLEGPPRSSVASFYAEPAACFATQGCRHVSACRSSFSPEDGRHPSRLLRRGVASLLPPSKCSRWSGAHSGGDRVRSASTDAAEGL